MKVIGFTIAALAILLTVAAASAQTLVRCYPMRFVLDRTLTEYGESPAYVFSNRRDETFVLTLNEETGSWSTFVQAESGKLCPVSSGMNFGPVPDAFKQLAIPGEDS